MKNSKNEIQSEELKCYETVIANIPEIERKGKTTPYTSLNGHMFSFLSKEGVMGLRLAKEDREAFIKTFNANIMEQHGRVMKEYVEVPNVLLKDPNQLSIFLQKSLNHVSSLKPKPTKNKK